jgi:hypothetical protein
VDREKLGMAKNQALIRERSLTNPLHPTFLHRNGTLEHRPLPVKAKREAFPNLYKHLERKLQGRNNFEIQDKLAI